MTKELDRIIQEITSEVASLDFIKTSKVPDIDLYMDQVTTLMEEGLKNSKRYPQDKVLTKTMINNYAKNDLIPSPIKKKYSKDHVLLLAFIYYFKYFLSIGDIQKLSAPLINNFYPAEDNTLSISDIYEQIFSVVDGRRDSFRDSINESLKLAQDTFTDAKNEDMDYLQLFSFISILSEDIFAKLLVVEKLIDTLPDIKN